MNAVTNISDSPEKVAKAVKILSGPKPTEHLSVRKAADIQPRPIHWLWRQRLSRGRHTDLVGFPGIGKTSIVMDLIARTTTGEVWPDGRPSEPIDVLIVAAEDDAEEVLIHRLIAAGANLERVHFLDGVRQGERMVEIDLSQSLDFAAIVAKVKQLDVGLIYVDALDDILGGAYDGQGYAKTRRALSPLKALARQTNACILTTRHPTKRIAVGDALNQGNGSIAYGAVVRGALLIVKDPNDPNRRLLIATKSNISKLADTLPFTLGSDQEDSFPRVIWDKADPRTADEILAVLREQEGSTPRNAEAEASKLDEAVALIKECLADEWLPVDELASLARQRGVSERTLERAKADLGLRYEKESGSGRGRRGSWYACGLPGVVYSATHRQMAEQTKNQASTQTEVVAPQTDTAA
jgi:putative DNA primase/helicase